jgi:ubiquitin C-terminal hydrolase
MEQHDAHEFLRFALDAIHEEVNSVEKPPQYEELQDIDNEPIRETAMRWMNNHLRRNKSFVHQAFAGQFASITTCKECNYKSIACDFFLDLSLPVPRSSKEVKGTSSPGVSITQALYEFFSRTPLDGDDKYNCPKCKCPTRGEREVRLFTIPEILVVHLKRFRHSRVLASKVNEFVDFPLDSLDVAPYLHPNSPMEPSTARYNLRGVVNHMGGVHSGHYTATCRCQPANGREGWYEFNDSSVTAVKNLQSVASPSVYLLFYERANHAKSSKY